MTHHRNPLRRAAFPLLLVLALLLAACGDAEDGAAPDTGEDNAEDTAVVEDELTNQLIGLEVTVAGNVSEVVDDNAFRIDKDGLGQPTDTSGDDVVGDYDAEYFEGDDYYYDYEYGTAYDDEFGDAGVLEEGALVLDVSQTDVELNDGVRVNGTIRRFEETTLEDVYDVDLDDDLYDAYEDHLVLVASNVRKVESPDRGSESPAPSSSASATATPTEG